VGKARPSEPAPAAGADLPEVKASAAAGATAARAEAPVRADDNAPAAALTNVTTAEVGANLPGDSSPMAEIPAALANAAHENGEVVQEPTEVMRFQDFAAAIRDSGPLVAVTETPPDSPPLDERDSASLRPVQIAATPVRRAASCSSEWWRAGRGRGAGGDARRAPITSRRPPPR
jgi:hypothetical protein